MLAPSVLQKRFSETFLPNEYPHSVNPGYARFTIYSNLSALFATSMSFISTQALFVSIGSTMN